MSSRGPFERTLRALRFLLVGPLLLALLFVVNLVTSPGTWWVHWAALGIGIAWLVSLFRVLKAALLVGGLAALWTIVQRQRAPGAEPPAPPAGPSAAGGEPRSPTR